MNSTTRALGAAVAAALLAACGGDGKAPAKQATGNAHVTASAPAPTPGAQAPGTTASAPSSVTSGTVAPPAATGPAKPGTTSGPGATAQPTAVSSPRSPEDMKASHMPLNVTLAKSCVRPGETQTVSFRARPRMRVIGNTGYADRQDGTVHGGRFNNVNTDDKGYFTTTWTVSRTAPHGEASVQVAAVDQYGTGSDKKTFKVSAVC